MSIQDEVYALSQGNRPADTAPAAFRKAVARYPNRAAVRTAGQCLTYSELERAADRLAGKLMAIGCRPGDVVAVRIANRLDQLIGMLGSWKAACVYLPLDPSAPAKRSDVVLANTRARVLDSLDSLPDELGPT